MVGLNATLIPGVKGAGWKIFPEGMSRNKEEGFVIRFELGATMMREARKSLLRIVSAFPPRDTWVSVNTREEFVFDLDLLKERFSKYKDFGKCNWLTGRYVIEPDFDKVESQLGPKSLFRFFITRDNLTEKAPQAVEPAEQFELKDLIGQGAEAKVWKTWDKALERWVAVRILNSEIGNEVEHARKLARVNHENIVTVHQLGSVKVPNQDGLHPGIILEFIDGGNLGELLQDRILTIPELQKFGPAIIEGVGHLHKNGITHGDLHAENVLISADGSKIKLLDLAIDNRPFSTLSMDLQFAEDLMILWSILLRMLCRSELNRAHVAMNTENAPANPSMDTLREEFNRVIDAARGLVGQHEHRDPTDEEREELAFLREELRTFLDSIRGPYDEVLEQTQKTATYTPRGYYDIPLATLGSAPPKTPAAKAALDHLDSWMTRYSHLVVKGARDIKVKNKERMLSFVGCCVAKAIKEIDIVLGVSSPMDAYFGGRAFREMKEPPWEGF